MNIQQLEAVLEEMRAARFDDLHQAHAAVEGWRERLDAAVAAHLTEQIQWSMGALRAAG